jgi:3-deoxy-7-phosphoheptulonate synthase
MLRAAADRHGLGVVSEVMDAAEVPRFAEWVDALQIGARNMQNFGLLEAAGRSGKPVLIKRGLAATLDELLWAAEYVLATGNPQVVLCERGIRTYEPSTRNTLDISAIPVLRERTHLPVVVDPSHAAGVRRYVPPLARAAQAVGADGVMIEIHPRPEQALSDGPQSLTLPAWDELARELSARRWSAGGPWS